MKRIASIQSSEGVSIGLGPAGIEQPISSNEVIIVSTDADTYLTSGSPTTKQHTAGTLYCGFSISGSILARRPMMRFPRTDFAGMTSADIFKAELLLNCFANAASAANCFLYGMNQTLNPISWTGLTWNHFDDALGGSGLWGTAGGESNWDIATPTQFLMPIVTGPFVIDITTTFREYIDNTNGESTLAFMMLKEVEATSTIFFRASALDLADGLEPKLRVTLR